MAAECSRLYNEVDDLRNRSRNAMPEQIYMRNTANDGIVGPFGEAEVHAWYRTGWFHSGTEFRFESEQTFITLAELRRINGPSCQFIRPFSDSSYFERILEQVGKVQRVCEDTEFTCTMLTNEVQQLKSDNSELRRQLRQKGIMGANDEWNNDDMDDDVGEHHGSSLPTFGDERSTSDQLSWARTKDYRHTTRDDRSIRSTNNQEEICARSVFVRNLDYACTNEDMANHFAEAGRVCRATVLRNQDGDSKCCAYVEFSHPDGQANAIKLNGTVLHGRRIQVDKKKATLRSYAEDGHSQSNRQLKNLSDDRDHNDVRQSTRRWENNNNARDDELHGRGHNESNENNRWHQNTSPLDMEEEINSKILFVGNLVYDCTKEELTAHFADCGRITRVTILYDKATGESRGSAFIDFADRAGRQRALAKHDSLLRGRAICVAAKQKKNPHKHAHEKENNE